MKISVIFTLCWKNIWKFNNLEHSVKITRFWISEFSREINFESVKSAKTAFFWHFSDSEFSKLCPSKSHENQNPEPLNVLKWQFLVVKIRQIGFHVKSAIQKYSVISTLCMYRVTQIEIFYFKWLCFWNGTYLSPGW